jgi:hypothetical protein
MKMKAFAKKISEEMGYNGELSFPVIKEANRILKEHGLEKHFIPEPIPDRVLERLAHDKEF